MFSRRNARTLSCERFTFMALVNLSLKHGRTLDAARDGLEMTVTALRLKFGHLLRQVEWAPDRHSVKLTGIGFEIEIRVDPQDMHLTADSVLLGKVMSSSIVNGLRGIIEQIFQRRLDRS